MIYKKGNTNEERDPLPSKQEEDGGQHVQAVLEQHQGVEAGTLVIGVLLFSCQLIKSDQLEKYHMHY